MTEADKIAAVTACYNQFDNMKITSEKTGIPYPKVTAYVKYERLPNILKQLKNNGKISLDNALAVSNMFGFTSPDIGDIPEQEIIEAAMESEKLTTNQKKQLEKAKKEEPNESIKSLIKRIQEIKIVIKAGTYTD